MKAEEHSFECPSNLSSWIYTDPSKTNKLHFEPSLSPLIPSWCSYSVESKQSAQMCSEFGWGFWGVYTFSCSSWCLQKIIVSHSLSLLWPCVIPQEEDILFDRTEIVWVCFTSCSIRKQHHRAGWHFWRWICTLVPGKMKKKRQSRDLNLRFLTTTVQTS